MKNTRSTGGLHGRPPFTGDLTRQIQLNRSVDWIIKKQKTDHLQIRLKPVIKKTGTALCIIILGFAYGLILGAQV